MLKKVWLVYLFTTILWACKEAPITTPTAKQPTSTPTLIVTSSPTIIWFPPTATHTPFATPVVTPTADMRPSLGSILLEDDFSSQVDWSLSNSEQGNVAYGNDELTIAIGETNAYLYSIRENPIFTNYYLEITAAPSLCRDLDEYGVLFRVSQTLDYYRFSLSCNGQVRLDRISGGKASSPQPWMPSGAVPPGAPSSSRLGILAVGSEMKFFVNEQYQFSVVDPLLTAGGLGVFARSTNGMAVTVNFSNLIVYEVTQ